MNTEDTNDATWWGRWGLFMIALVVVVIVWGLFWIGCVRLIPQGAQRSEFGEMFGAINALFSAVAFAALFCALKFQRDELQLQREELKLTRDELRKSGEAQRESSLALVRQAELLRATGELNAVVARIAVYDTQISEAYTTKQFGTVDRLQKERLSLHVHLNGLLERFAKEGKT